MDSQMERNTSFVGLLKKDCTGSMGSPNSNSQMDELLGDIESGVKKPRGGNFTIEDKFRAFMVNLVSDFQPSILNRWLVRNQCFLVWLGSLYLAGLLGVLLSLVI
jgi:hypothetical protein